MKDLAWWAGVTLKVARSALRSVAPREVRLEGREDVLYASESSLAQSERRGPDASVTLLPHWDPYLTAHVDRSRYLAERWRDRVIDRGGNSTNVILMDGKASGVWDYSEGLLAYAGFESPLSPRSLRAASRPFLPVLGDLDVVERARAPHLHEGGQNAFRAPLRGVSPARPES